MSNETAEQKPIVLTTAEGRKLAALIDKFCAMYACDVDELLVDDGEMEIYRKLTGAAP
jgi:hypothetical protein